MNKSIVIKTTARITSLLLLLAVAGGFALLHTQGGKLFSVQSGSMVPNLSKGDLVAVTRVSEGQLAVGDVITYTNPKNMRETITHRVVELPSSANAGRILTKGDANPTVDAPILPSAVVGKVDFSAPYVGAVIDFIRTPVGLLLLVYIPALAVIWRELKLLSNYFRRMQPYIAAWRRDRQAKSGKGMVIGIYVGVATLIGGILAIGPVAHAVLLNQASLTGNTIAATNLPTEPPDPGTGQVLFRQLTLRCSLDNTTTANKRPQIVLYNTERRTSVDVSGWKIADNSGIIVTLPANTVIKRAHKLTITPLLSNGLDYAGDRLILQNSSGQNIDTLSWGADTSQFNPSIQGMTAGTKAKRLPVRTDTNTANDWRLNQNQCRGGSDPTAPAGQGGGNDPDCYDTTETDRTTVVGMFHILEQQSSDDD